MTASPTSVRQETGRDSHSGDGGKIARVVGGAAGRDAAAAGPPHYGAGADAGDAVDDDDVIDDDEAGCVILGFLKIAVASE